MGGRNQSAKDRTMKIGDLVILTENKYSIGVLLDRIIIKGESLEWVVHWFDDNDWSYEFQKDLRVIK